MRQHTLPQLWEWEQERNRWIAAIQGHSNRFIDQ
jgi:endonuclease I